MTFTTPLALLLLALIVPVAYLGWPRLRYRRRRDVFSLILRATILTLLVLALAGAQITQSADRLAVVFLVDVSDSMGAEAQDAAFDYIREALPDMPPDDVAGIVLFGSDAQVERSLSAVRELGEVRAAPATGNTDLAEAIRLGLALFPGDVARRMVLLSDGLPTVGDTEAAARLAAAANVQISYVPFSAQRGPEVQVRDLNVPTVLNEDQEFDLTVRISSEANTPARVTVLESGQIVHSEDLQLNEGTNNYTLTLNSGSAGFRDFLVQVDPLDGDNFYQNNQLGAFSRVEGEPRVLVIGGSPEDTEYLVPALEESGLTVDSTTPGEMAIGLAQISQYDTIMLANVSSEQLGIARMEMIETYVGDLGGGLVVVGGPDAYGPGGYFQTPLEDVLPVETQIRDQQRLPQLTLVYLLDRSGSMGISSPRGIPHIDLAKEAIIRSIGLLQDTDRVAITSFDAQAYWIANFQQVNDGRELQRLVASLRSGGGTSIMAGMQLVASTIIEEPSELKHIILLTDGGASPNGLIELTRDLNNAANVTTSVISIGSGSPNFLQQMADAGQGNFHGITDTDNIPNIFAQETVLATRSYILEDPFTPTVTAINPSNLHPILQGISNLPQLQGYVATTPRPPAQLIMRGPEPFSDPLLAAWQYGLGRSVAFTSDASARWGAQWVTWEDYSRFWSQAVRWTLTEGASANLETQVVMENEVARVIVDARTDDGEFLNGLDIETNVVFDPGAAVGDPGAERIQLRQVAPGRYEGTFSPQGEGAHFLRTNATDGEGVEYSQNNGWVMTYSPEYQIRRSDPALLANVAEVTGGRNLANASGAVFLHDIEAVSAATPLWPILLLIVLLLLPLDIAVRRLVVTASDLQRLRAWTAGLFARERDESTEARMSSLKDAVGRSREETRNLDGPEPAAQGASGGATASGASAGTGAPTIQGGIRALRQRRQETDARQQQAREPREAQNAKPATSSPTKPAAPPRPRYTPPAPDAKKDGGKEEEETGNIGSRLLKRRKPGEN